MKKYVAQQGKNDDFSIIRRDEIFRGKRTFSDAALGSDTDDELSALAMNAGTYDDRRVFSPLKIFKSTDCETITPIKRLPLEACRGVTKAAQLTNSVEGIGKSMSKVSLG